MVKIPETYPLGTLPLLWARTDGVLCEAVYCENEHCIDLASGKLVWQVPLGVYASSPRSPRGNAYALRGSRMHSHGGPWERD